ncbi:MAG: MFS transporter [bacterium]
MVYQISNTKKSAFYIIILLGLVSLFGDIIYEGAKSITGPFLSILGASAAVVGLVSGIGEFLGYSLRLLFGWLSDRTERYWFFTFLGYGLLVSIPLLAYVGKWQLSALLIIMERMGKAIRAPSRDVILSYSTKQVGRGWGFGIHEALDQIGAVIGPLLFSIVIFLKGSYRDGFMILWIPVILTLAILSFARYKVPSPEKLEKENGKDRVSQKSGLPRIFWIYTIFIFFSIAGYANFPVISYHLKVASVVSEAQIPLFFAIAMGVDAVVALIIGKVYDKIGLLSLIVIPVLTILIPFLGFSLVYIYVLVGVILWGAVMGIHETVMRASIADIVQIERRGFAYGVFNTVYGLSWFLGSAMIGFLYEISITYIIIFAVSMEVLSIPFLFMVKKKTS